MLGVKLDQQGHGCIQISSHIPVVLAIDILGQESGAGGISRGSKRSWSSLDWNVQRWHHILE